MVDSSSDFNQRGQLIR